jgi:hypothetical protein
VPIRVPQSGLLPDIRPTGQNLFFRFSGFSLPIRLVPSKNVNMLPEHKYSRIEHERWAPSRTFPNNVTPVRVRRITDRYIDGTTLRLREQSEDSGQTMFKLTQKVPARAGGALE